ncbi:MAG: hypothetical protein GC168_15065 [Candidatus Hydrogenedens sp.]|nr:hypothetical protein [Candidatus Hydrogenedens sp.]
MRIPIRSSALAGLAIAAGLVTAALNTESVYGQPPVPDKAKDWTYVGQGQCKVCHNGPKEGAQWDKWHNALHAHALELLETDAAKEAAVKAGLTTPPAESPECLKCHVTGYDPVAKAAPAKITPADGVQCESCHGPASEHLKDAKVLKFTPAKISEIDILAHQLVPTEETCRGCHNDSSPTWKADRYTLENGEKVGFDFKQAWAKIAHDHPEGVMEDKYGGKYPVD